jgi:hypothetical protein
MVIFMDIIVIKQKAKKITTVSWVLLMRNYQHEGCSALELSNVINTLYQAATCVFLCVSVFFKLKAQVRYSKYHQLNLGYLG